MDKIQGSNSQHFCNADWEPVLREYKLTDCLGKGAFGTVVGGVCLSTGQKVAIKLIANI